MAVAGTNRAALVLSAGGAWGAYEVGVMKALASGAGGTASRTPLQADAAELPDVFTGTSLGGLNAAVMTMAEGDFLAAVKRLEQIWLYEIADRGGSRGNGIYRMRGNPPGYLEQPGGMNPLGAVLRAAGDAAFLGSQWALRASQFMTAEGTLGSRALGLIDVGSFISIEPFAGTLERILNLEAIRKSAKTLRIIATNWETGDVKVFTNESMTDRDGKAAILASAAIPGIFPPVTINAAPYVDGSVVASTPLNFALDACATRLHVIYVNPEVTPIPVQPLPNTIDTFERVYATMMAAKINEDISTAEWINRGLAVLERASAGVAVSGAEELDFMKVAAQIHARIRSRDAFQRDAFQKVTIHRYSPTRNLSGPLGILNFSQGQIRELIEMGVEDTGRHDCRVNRCVVPAG